MRALHALSPAAAAAEEVAGEWMLELLGLPADASVGLPTGAGLGNAVGMAAGRHRLSCSATGWDVEAAGLYGAPEIVVIIGDEAHATVLTALQYLGFGRDRVTRVATDEQGRMRVDALGPTVAALDPRSPLLVIAQAGNVNTGGFDPMGRDRGCPGGAPERAGCTSTAPSGCGRPCRRTCATWWPGSRRRTRGRPTPTSG